MTDFEGISRGLVVSEATPEGSEGTWRGKKSFEGLKIYRGSYGVHIGLEVSVEKG